jgi:hypothetical protein
MVFTPVGVRCRECARLRPPAQYDLQGVRGRVVATAAAIVVVGGGVLGWLHLTMLGMFLSMLVGLAAGEALSRVSRRKQGRPMEVLTGLTVVLTVLVATAVTLLGAGVADMGVALARAVASLTSIYSLLGLVLGVVLAVGRVR